MMDILRIDYKAADPVGVTFPHVVFHFLGYDHGSALELINATYSGLVASLVDSGFKDVSSLEFAAGAFCLVFVHQSIPAVPFVPSIEYF